MAKASSRQSVPKSIGGNLFGQLILEPSRCLLGHYPFPARLNHLQRRQFQESGKAKWISKGKILFREGDLPRAVCIILAGRVKKSITSSQGRTLVIGFFGPGSVLGLEANILGRAYMATGETTQETLVMAVSRKELIRELQNNPAAWLVAQLVSENSYFLAGKLASMGLSKSAHQSVARYLMELDGSSANRDGESARPNLTQETIAQLLGFSRETVTRQLMRFRRAGLLEWNRSSFVIRDRPTFEKLANFPHAAA